MNRAPVALFALLCTLASSMVAAGVAGDRPTTVAKSSHHVSPKLDARTVSFVGSSQDKWLTESGWQAIDIQRAVALPSKKLPVRIPEKVNPVAAVIITIEQPQVPATKPVAQTPVAKKSVAVKPAAIVTAPKQTTKAAVSKPVVVKAPAAAVAKVAAQPQTAAVLPRVTSLVKATYTIRAPYASVLYSSRNTVADLQFPSAASIKTSGSLSMPQIVTVPKPTVHHSNQIIIAGEKLKFAAGSFKHPTVGGRLFIASPFIAEDATSILGKSNLGTTGSYRPIAITTAKAAVKPIAIKAGTGWSVSEVANFHATVVRTSGNWADILGHGLNTFTTNYVSQVRSAINIDWTPYNNALKSNPTIKSAQLKTGTTSAVKK